MRRAGRISLVILAAATLGVARDDAILEERVDGKTVAQWRGQLTGDDGSDPSLALSALARFRLAPAEAIQVLRETIRDNPELRPQAARALGSYGDPAIPFLKQLLKDDDVEVRLDAADALWPLTEAPEALALYIDTLGDNDNRTRAANALWLIGPQAAAAVPKLLEGLNDQEVSYRLTAADALWNIARRTDGLPAIIAALDDPEESRSQAVYSLQGWGPAAKDAAPQLVELLKDSALNTDSHDPGFADTLAKIGPAAIKPLLALLADGDAQVRVAGLGALGLIGPRAAEAAATIRPLLKDESALVRVAAAHALWRIERKPDVAATFVAALDGMEADAAVSAVVSLELLGPAAEPAVPACVRLLSSPESDSTHDVAALLATIGPAARAAAPALIDRLDQPDEDPLRDFMVGCALTGVGLDPRSDLPRLREMLPDGGITRQIQIASILASAGHTGDDVLAVLKSALDDEDQTARALAALVAVRIGPKARSLSADLLAVAKDDEHPAVRAAAAWALWRIEKHAIAVPTLIDLISLPKRDAATTAEPAEEFTLDETAVTVVVVALGSMGEAAKPAAPALAELLTTGAASPEMIALVLKRLGPHAAAAVPHLVKFLERQPFDGSERILVVDVLAAIGPAAAPAVPVLTRMLFDWDDDVRRFQAADALAAIGPAAKSAVPVLQRILRGEDAFRRTSAAVALLAIAPEPAATQVALVALRSDLPELRRYAAERLGQRAPRGDAAVAAGLTAALQAPDQDGLTRATAAAALWALRPADDVRRALEEIERHEVGDPRVTAAAALWRVDRRPAALAAIVEELLVRSSESSAAQALAEIGPAAAVAVPALALYGDEENAGLILTAPEIYLHYMLLDGL